MKFHKEGEKWKFNQKQHNMTSYSETIFTFSQQYDTKTKSNGKTL